MIIRIHFSFFSNFIILWQHTSYLIYRTWIHHVNDNFREKSIITQFCQKVIFKTSFCSCYKTKMNVCKKKFNPRIFFIVWNDILICFMSEMSDFNFNFFSIFCSLTTFIVIFWKQSAYVDEIWVQSQYSSKIGKILYYNKNILMIT